MPDNLNRRMPEDPNKININQQWEIDYWTKELQVSESKLKQAVKTVGVMVADVKKWLREN
jgi:hypothetical protein